MRGFLALNCLLFDFFVLDLPALGRGFLVLRQLSARVRRLRPCWHRPYRGRSPRGWPVDLRQRCLHSRADVFPCARARLPFATGPASGSRTLLSLLLVPRNDSRRHAGESRGARLRSAGHRAPVHHFWRRITASIRTIGGNQRNLLIEVDDLGGETGGGFHLSGSIFTVGLSPEFLGSFDCGSLQLISTLSAIPVRGGIQLSASYAYSGHGDSTVFVRCGC